MTGILPFVTLKGKLNKSWREKESRRLPALFIKLFDVDPYSFTPNLGGINQIHQLCHPVAGFEYHAF